MPDPATVAPDECWLHPDVDVRASAIAGRGVFASRDLAEGTVVVGVGRAGDELHVHPMLNHACDPNLGWADDESLVLVVDVPAGTELVTDYALDTTDPAYLLRCHCPSPRCRQMVEGSDWRIPQLQRRYAGCWSPRVQRLIDLATQ